MCVYLWVILSVSLIYVSVFLFFFANTMLFWLLWLCTSLCQGQIGASQAHLPSASAGIKSWAAVAVDFWHALKGVQGKEWGIPGKLVEQIFQFSSVQSLSRVQLFATPWITACQASLSITNSRSSLRLTSIKSVTPASHLILCCPVLLLHPIPPSIRVFSNESTLRMRWPKYWSFSFSIIPSKETPGLISFRMDWLDLQSIGAAAALCWSSREQIPHIQDKRNPSKTVGVARGHQRVDTLKPYLQKTSLSNHTRTIALSNSIKLSHAQDGRVVVERCDRMWSTGEGNGKPLKYSCLENPMNSMKRQNDRILKEELPR